MNVKPASASASKRITVVSSDEETAKRIENHLRNAGHAVRTQWLDDLDSLRGLLKRDPPDLILAGDGVASVMPPDVIALRNELSPDLPVILMAAHRPTPAETVTALTAGAADFVSYGDAKHLQHLERACTRELKNLELLRELRRARTRLAEFESRTARILEGTSEAVAQVQEGILVHVNKAFAVLLGHKDSATLEGVPLMDVTAADFQPQAKLLLKQFAQGKLQDGVETELQLTAQDGSEITLNARLSRTQLEGEPALDILVKAEAAAVAVPASSLQASGRLELFNAMTEYKAGAMPAALLLLRIDEFNVLEDTVGFRDAEEIVVQFMQLLRSRLPKEDSVFRFSTAEFAWLALKVPAAGIAGMAEIVRREIAGQLYQSKRREAHLKVSIAGHAFNKGTAPSDMVTATVQELRKLSAQGGNRVGLVAPPQTPGLKEATAAGGDPAQAAQIKRAIEDNRLRMSYQSIASLEGDHRQHFDVLVRMIDEAGKEISGGDFIPAAEKFGLVQTIDRWVIARALKVLAKREGAAESSELFVHLSEATLKEPDAFITWIREQLKPRALKPDELVISIHEKILATQIGKAQTLAKGLAPLHIHMRINHWGSGTQSKELVEKIPVRYVRFDPAFTQSFNEPARQKRMTELMEIAKQRGLKTICSHVEDANVMARLWQLGINYIQGHHIHEPEVVLLSTDLPR
ncbi:MAG: EAL domain-containing protein [Pseudomonadota bacterium]